MSTLYVDNLQPNLGSRVMAAGHVVQVVEDVVTPLFTSVTSTSHVTIASVTITPSATSSKIILRGEGMFYKNNNGAGSNGAAFWSIYRNGVVVPNVGFLQENGTSHYAHYTDNTLLYIYPFSQSVTDTPNTTAAITYDFKVSSALGGTFSYYSGFKLTAMEIAQ